jgi:hypothetical protein
MYGDRSFRSPRSLNRHRSLIGPSCAFLLKKKCPINRTQLRIFSQRATPGVLLWIFGVRSDYRGKRDVLEEHGGPKPSGSAANCFLAGSVLAATIAAAGFGCTR